MKKTKRNTKSLGKFRPGTYAQCWLPGVTDPLTAKKGKTKGFIDLYQGRKRIWFCNETFFKAHFIRVAEGK